MSNALLSILTPDLKRFKLDEPVNYSFIPSMYKYTANLSGVTKELFLSSENDGNIANTFYWSFSKEKIPIILAELTRYVKKPCTVGIRADSNDHDYLQSLIRSRGLKVIRERNSGSYLYVVLSFSLVEEIKKRIKL